MKALGHTKLVQQYQGLETFTVNPEIFMSLLFCDFCKLHAVASVMCKLEAGKCQNYPSIFLNEKCDCDSEYPVLPGMRSERVKLKQCNMIRKLEARLGLATTG
jgi:hypothetical protein